MRRAAPGLRSAALALGLAAAACEGPDLGLPFDFERMLEQPRDEAYGTSPLFADRRSMRTPPEHTVPRPAPDVGPAAADAPPATDRALLSRGQDRFRVYCAPCHGAGGHADTPVAESMALRPPPSLHSERVRGLPPERLRAVVERGFGLMPSYGTLLSDRDAWAVVRYVEALQLAEGVPLESLPPELRRRAEAALPRPGDPGAPDGEAGPPEARP